MALVVVSDSLKTIAPPPDKINNCKTLCESYEFLLPMFVNLFSLII